MLFIALSQVFIFIFITVHLMIVCKKKKSNPVESNINPTPAQVPIQYNSNTESCSALSPAKGVTSATPAPKTVVGKTPSLKQPTPAPWEEAAKPDEHKVEAREKEKKQEKSLNTAYNERMKEDQSAGVSETV